MDFISIYRLLLRQKWVVIPTVIVVAALLAATVVSVPPTYRASSSIVLLNPPSPPAPEIGQTVDPSLINPYVSFDDISVVVDIIHRVMESYPVVQDLNAAGLDGTFTVAANVDFARGPLIDIASEAGSAAAAVNDVGLVSTELAKQLQAMQSARGTNSHYFITTQVIVPASRATKVFSATLRRLIAVGALGVVATLALAIGSDAMSKRRRKRRSAKGHDGTRRRRRPATTSPARVPAARRTDVAETGPPRDDSTGTRTLRPVDREPAKEASSISVGSSSNL